MIEAIRAGTLIRLPSGNIVIVVSRESRHEWLCTYAEGSRARGDVVFTTAFLRDWGTRV